ncbi:MAG: ABC transporter permease subunit [Spirochaetales bacterium]|jgi:ABC-2 type transport system permease protein|nr:ABC transporter permease [Exilispira sp.]NMC67999.1 ABC transporter permease subunit [Spirochaetales bacterium]
MKSFFKSINVALKVETIKTIKSKVFLWIILFSLFVSFMLWVLFYMIKNPTIARESIILRAKANILGSTADWKTFHEIMNMLIAIIGFISFGFLTIWIFGREYVEKTYKDLLALPIKREAIIMAKTINSFLFSIVIAFFLYLFSMIAAFLVGLGEFDSKIALFSLKRYLIISLMNIALTTVLSFITSIARSYIMPFGFLVLMILVSNFAINLSENSQYIPWAIPLIYAGMFIKEGLTIDFISYIILAFTCFLGFVSTIIFWVKADQR